MCTVQYSGFVEEYVNIVYAHWLHNSIYAPQPGQALSHSYPVCVLSTETNFGFEFNFTMYPLGSLPKLRLIITLITLSLCLPLASTSSASQAPSEHDYNEHLTLRPLPGNSLLASFNFKSNGSLDYGDHMLLFPRSLKQVLTASWARELHVKFTLGRWNAEEYGVQPSSGRTAGGTGVEVWAWVEAGDEGE